MKSCCMYLLLLGLGTGLIRSPARSQVEIPAPARARHGMVASANALASQAGVEILKRGGNAVDVAVAVGLALAVTTPEAGNIGGGGFMLIRMADGNSVALDYREAAPRKATRTLYLDRAGNVIPQASTVGHLAVGVPGTVAGFARALERYGTMRWRDVVEPARKLAEKGFPVSHALALGLRSRESLLSQFPESRRIFLKNGLHYREGEIFRQPDLARTLKRLQQKGPRDFYEGATARLLVEEMERNGGLITLEDLKAYRPVEREPVRGEYRGYKIISMPPPSSGGAVLIEMLNMLEGYDLAALGHNSSKTYHLLIEVMRRGFADRAEHFGDPAFVRVPVNALTSESYARSRAQSIDMKRATPSTEVKPGRPMRDEPPQTTHYTVVDAKGNVVSNTYTLNTAYGSGVTVRGAGFLLNNEMDDFTAKPGSPNAFGLIQGEANAIAPGKRPLSSMTPTLVLKEGKLFVALGSPGGPTIINSVMQVLLNLIDHGMTLQGAVNAPRIHHQWLPDRVRHEPYGLARDVREALEAKGHRFEAEPRWMGDVEAIMIEPGTGMRLGASDPRNPDAGVRGY
ncbi:MAG: gamma-glutamyltransferase [Armatimonadetes bacterium]|nr:gamma-glutamyltransferase [Armatimonadota bacterium]